jgi:hypothetical protein
MRVRRDTPFCSTDIYVLKLSEKLNLLKGCVGAFVDTLSLANNGWEAAIAKDTALAKGLNVHAGKICYEAVAVAHGYSM